VVEGKLWASKAAVRLSSIGFGLVHFYEGLGGILSNAGVGLCLGTLYLFQKRSLWSNILAHGVVDTLAMVAFFLGWL